MEGYPFQPTLLSLQDMLNLSDDEFDNDTGSWTSNPYNISNFYEPIAGSSFSPTKSTSQVPVQPQHLPFKVKEEVVEDYYDDIDQTPEPVAGPSSAVHGISLDFLDALKSPPKKQAPQVPLPRSVSIIEPTTVKVEDENHFQLDDLEMFDESLVTSEMQASGLGGSDTEIALIDESYSLQPEEILPDLDLSPSPSPTKRTTFTSPVPHWKESASARLMEVKLGEEEDEDVKVSDEKVQPKENRRHAELNSYRQDAVDKLDSLIDTLKRFSIGLQHFLDDEGQMIVEHYEAQKLLSGILPEMTQSTESDTLPFEMAHSMTQAIIDHQNRRTFLATLPQRRPKLWRSSNLLDLQKAVLESAVERRAFFLNCRYTELLTEMGFDREDIEKLTQCETKTAELARMKVILLEHQIGTGGKKPIRQVVARERSKWMPTPHFFSLPAPEQLIRDKWKSLDDIRRKTILSNLQDKDIDWLSVSRKLLASNSKLNVDETTCQQTYDHLLNVHVNNSPWHVEELIKLRDLRDQNKNHSWPEIAQMLGTKRTPFSCFVKYKTHCLDDTGEGYIVPTSMYQLIHHYLEEAMGNVYKVDYRLFMSTTNHLRWINPGKLLAVAQKFLNPRFRKGRFSLQEDALLLVVVEKHKDLLIPTKRSPECVGYTLPWRHTHHWMVRLKCLLTTLGTKTWTFEEDQLLLKLVPEYGPNYKLIQRWFPQKDRKKCRHRFIRLTEALQSGKPLEEYRLFERSKRKPFSIHRLKQVAEYLHMTLQSKLRGIARYVKESDLEFLKLRRAPKDSNLDNYLLSFSIDIIASTLTRLCDFLIHVVDKWTALNGTDGENTKDPVEKMKYNAEFLTGFDRRKFDANCAASVASALHVRNAELVPPENLCNLTQFETDVYVCYKFFSRRGKAKGRTKRAGIPTLDMLRELSTVSRIIVSPPSRGKQPCVIIRMQTSEEVEGQDSRVLKEFENMQKGGSLKGSKRKRTSTRETRKKAAQLRWEKARAVAGALSSASSVLEGNCSEASSPLSTWSDIYSVPSEPVSVFKTESTYSQAHWEPPEIRNATIGLISDHASYVLPTLDPSNYVNLPLNQIFAKFRDMNNKLGTTQPKMETVEVKMELLNNENEYFES